jgi:hypothetical protein
MIVFQLYDHISSSYEVIFYTRLLWVFRQRCPLSHTAMIQLHGSSVTPATPSSVVRVGFDLIAFVVIRALILTFIHVVVLCFDDLRQISKLLP